MASRSMYLKMGVGFLVDRKQVFLRLAQPHDWFFYFFLSQQSENKSPTVYSDPARHVFVLAF
jgi:hypothetical protein